MKLALIGAFGLQVLRASAAAISQAAEGTPEAKNWNAAAWSNFVKVYAVDERMKRDVDDWNAKAWSNFVKVYTADDDKVKRDEDWNAKAWSNFVKVYAVDDGKIKRDEH